mmetsp:Transcript_27514/g.77840  ORF Transcript_27514/g.77840 Transcript_27514/m.77840 type:complete len:216 (-) Transcript_27514:4059-4706(-)
MASPAPIMGHGLLFCARLSSHGGGDTHLVGPGNLSVVVYHEGTVIHVGDLAVKAVWAIKGHLKGVGVAGQGPQVLVGVNRLNDVCDRHRGTALAELVQAEHVRLVIHVGGGSVGDIGVDVSLGGLDPLGVGDDDAVQLHVDQVVAAHLTGEVHQIAAIIHVLNPLANCELIDLGVEMQRPDNLNGEAIPSREATAAALVVRLDAEHHALPGQTLD